jgi:hypothetical protein
MISGELRSVLQEAMPEGAEGVAWFKRLTSAWAADARSDEAHEVITKYVRDLAGEQADEIIARVELLDLMQRMRAWPIWNGAAMDPQDPWQLYSLIGLYTERLVELHRRGENWPESYVHIQPRHVWMLGDTPFEDYGNDAIWDTPTYATLHEQGPTLYDGPFARWRDPASYKQLYASEYKPPLFDAEEHDNDGWSKLPRYPQLFIQTMSLDYHAAHHDALTRFQPDYFATHHNLRYYEQSSYHDEFALSLIKFVEDSRMFTVFFDEDGWCHHVAGCWGHARHEALAEVYIDCWE